MAAVLCPEGWAASRLRLAFHPTPERRYEEMVHMRANLERLRDMGDNRRRRQVDAAGEEDRQAEPPPPDPLPDRETFLAEARAQPDEPVESATMELGRLVGLCSWDVPGSGEEASPACHRARLPRSLRPLARRLAAVGVTGRQKRL